MNKSIGVVINTLLNIPDNAHVVIGTGDLYTERNIGQNLDLSRLLKVNVTNGLRDVTVTSRNTGRLSEQRDRGTRLTPSSSMGSCSATTSYTG